MYSIFRTPWGWFGLLGHEASLLRTCLPMAFKEAVERRLLTGIEGAVPAKRAFCAIEGEIIAYYEGVCVDFAGVSVDIKAMTDFQQRVLLVLRSISYGKTISYSDLAGLASCPRGGRAIGSVMARNPLPLIIPCHRVIKSDGSLGYFSAAGGIETKRRMLDLEKSARFP